MGDKEKLQLMAAGAKAEIEKTQRELREKKEEASQLRRENKALRMTLSTNVKVTTDIQGKEVEVSQQQVFALRRKLDDIRNSIIAKKQQYHEIKEKNSELDAERKPILPPQHPLNTKINMLENRLDKSMVKYNEAMNIRRTYEAIVKRLQQERVTFDNQLASIEKTLQAKEDDLRELENMKHDASHARDISKAELLQFKTAFEDERKQRKLDLEDRQSFVNTRKDRLKAQKKAEPKVNQEQIRKEAEEEERKRRAQQAASEAKSEEERDRLNEYADDYKRIKEVTGADSVDDVILKFMAQQDTHDTLADMTTEAQAKLDRLNAERAELRSKMEEAKFSGSGQLGSRRILDEFDAHLAEAKIQASKSRDNYEELARVHIDVKAGVEHLVDRLSTFKPEIHSTTTTEENLVEVMRFVGHKLQLLMDETVGATEVTTEELAANGTMELPPHNLRVRLTDKEEDEEVVQEEDDEGDEDVYDRERVKKFAQIAVLRETKRRNKKKKNSED
eukprot:PhM_4_TR8271/c0_g1_i1/m.53453